MVFQNALNLEPFTLYLLEVLEFQLVDPKLICTIVLGEKCGTLDVCFSPLEVSTHKEHNSSSRLWEMVPHFSFVACEGIV